MDLYSVPVSVIGSQFMAPCPFDIIVDTNSRGDLLITDTNHKVMFKVKPCNTSFHEQRLLVDVYDRPIATLREKIMSEHDRWNVFRGDSKADSDMIFSAKTAHAFQSKTNIHVFLANNMRKKDACDFKLKGSWSNRNCALYTGDWSKIIAQMRALQPVENSRLDKFMVTVYPFVDYAFVVAVIAVVDAMKSSTSNDAVVEGVTEAILGS